MAHRNTAAGVDGTLAVAAAELAPVDSGAMAYATYVGIAVHDFTGYAAMAP
jgi:hypothetical protein